jgi:hypothetical protein
VGESIVFADGEMMEARKFVNELNDNSSLHHHAIGKDDRLSHRLRYEGFRRSSLVGGWIRRWSSLFRELIIGKILKMEIYRKQQKGVLLSVDLRSYLAGKTALNILPIISPMKGELQCLISFSPIGLERRKISP